MKRKAQSISINTIVIAAIALIVLVVIIAIFGGSIKDFVTGVKDCETLGGDCVEGDECPDEEGTLYTSYKSTDCGDGWICCKKLYEPPEQEN